MVEYAFNKILLIIIGLLVLFAVLFFIFKPNILNFFKNLPDYGKPGQANEITVGQDEYANLVGIIKNREVYYLLNGKFVDTNLKVVGYIIYLNSIEVGRINLNNQIAFFPELLDSSITPSNEFQKNVPDSLSGIYRTIVLKDLYQKSLTGDMYNTNIPKKQVWAGIELKASEIKVGDKVNSELVLNWKDLQIGSAAYRQYRDDLDNIILVETFLDFDAQGNPIGYKPEVTIIKILDNTLIDENKKEMQSVWILKKNE